jgi:hypothetical protein
MNQGYEHYIMPIIFSIFSQYIYIYIYIASGYEGNNREVVLEMRSSGL